MRIYAVGGCIRDELLGKEPKDFDYVVVGSTPDEMISLGFHRVGASFPVFLHPVSQDEYALARTERKNGNGYHGFQVDFSPSVTINDDLFRRDCTINAMCREVLDFDGNIPILSRVLIDPFGGKNDLINGTLRHVSHHFRDDPVRYLRVCRFSARYNFTIHETTSRLIKDMISNGELKHLQRERIWMEVEKALHEASPSKFFEELISHGGVSDIFNSDIASRTSLLIDSRPHLMDKIEQPVSKLAALFRFFPREVIERFIHEHCIPGEYAQAIKIVTDFYTNHDERTLRNFCQIYKFLSSHNCLRDHNRLSNLCTVIEADVLSFAEGDNISKFLKASCEVINSISFDDIPLETRETIEGKNIGNYIKQLQEKRFEEFVLIGK